MKFRSIVFVFLILLISQCQRDDEVLKRLYSIAEFKLTLVAAKEGNNLLSNLNSNSDNYQMEFENGILIEFKRDFINQIEIDSTSWIIKFYFSDNSTQDVNFIGKLPITQSNIILDPFLSNPLSALATFDTPVKGKFKIKVRGEIESGIELEKAFESYSENHYIPILGLYENLNNSIEFIFTDKDGNKRCSTEILINPGSITNYPILDFQVVKNSTPSSYQGLYIVFSHRAGFDQTGRLRWLYTGDGKTFYGKLRNGNFISSCKDNSCFYEVSMLGQTVKKFNVPYALHHEILELPSGNFLVATHSPPGPPLEDVVVEIDRNTGVVVKTWDFNKILDPTRKVLPDTQTGDWLHINAMYYDEADNSIVVSARSQSAVIKIDYFTGTVKWILGNPNFWTETYQPYLLKPVDTNGNEINVSIQDFWCYGQHAIQKVSNGNVMMYDNGDYRGFYDNQNVPQESYTRLVEYKINEALKTVSLNWEYDNSKSYFTKYTGYVQELTATHSRLAAFMWVTQNTPRIIELDASNNIIFEATLKQEVNAVYYRTYKIDVYAGL